MSNSGDFHHIPASFQSPARPPEDVFRQSLVDGADPRDPLLNLSTVRDRMDTLQRFLSDSINNDHLIGKEQMDMVSTEISSAIHQIIVNGAALLASTAQIPSQPATHSSIIKPPSDRKFQVNLADVELKTSISAMNRRSITDATTDFKVPGDLGDAEMKTFAMNRSSIMDTTTDLKVPENLGDVEVNTPMDLSNSIDTDIKGVVEMKVKDEIIPSENWDIIELGAVELLAEHIHFCDICGKGFKRDANLRMHMRAHGNQFKTPEALARPEMSSSELNRRKATRFSCPFLGCNRNKSHKKFRPLKSVICVKNHFKRSHCPKMYSCNRCNKKNFSVVADLKSHLKHCGESKWKCSCGTTFSRKDKLFGHMALFEGHMPAVVEEEEKVKRSVGAEVVMEEEEEEEDDDQMREVETGDTGFFEGLLDGFGNSSAGYCLQDVLGSPVGLGATMNEFFTF